MTQRDEGQEKRGTYPIKWTELHCPGCGRRLGRYRIVWGEAEYPCRTCKKPVTVSITPEEDDQNDIEASVRRGDTYSQIPIDKKPDPE